MKYQVLFIGEGLDYIYFTQNEVYYMDNLNINTDEKSKSAMMFMIDKWRNNQIIKNYEKKTNKKFDNKTINSIYHNKIVDKSKSWLSVVTGT
jgi:hypothetical protein